MNMPLDADTSIIVNNLILFEISFLSKKAFVPSHVNTSISRNAQGGSGVSEDTYTYFNRTKIFLLEQNS